MSAPTAQVNGRRSAYPATTAELLPAARDLAAQLGELPSQRRLTRELRIGGPKANAVRAALAAELAAGQGTAGAPETTPDAPASVQSQPVSDAAGRASGAVAEPEVFSQPAVRADAPQTAPSVVVSAAPAVEPEATPEGPSAVRRWASRLGAAAVAGIAAVASYSHMRHLAMVHGQTPLISALLPLSVDGLVMVGAVAIGDGRRHTWSAWLAFVAGVLASVAANVLAARPDAISRVVSAWPAVALLLVVEVLSRSGRMGGVR